MQSISRWFFFPIYASKISYLQGRHRRETTRAADTAREALGIAEAQWCRWAKNVAADAGGWLHPKSLAEIGGTNSCKLEICDWVRRVMMVIFNVFNVNYNL